MNILYKYCSMAGIKILENCTIKVTPPNQFNDPFEFGVYAQEVISKDFIRQLVQDEELMRDRFAQLEPKRNWTCNKKVDKWLSCDSLFV